jgi:Ca2+-binding EF-hand superfamily protein
MEQNPKGTIDKESYLRMTTAACGDETRYMFERIFDVWDANHDGSVDFKEFITSTSVMMHGNLEQKLRCTCGVGSCRTRSPDG